MKRRPFEDLPITETHFLYPAANVSFSHNQLKAESESQPVFVANCLNNRQSPCGTALERPVLTGSA